MQAARKEITPIRMWYAMRMMELSLWLARRAMCLRTSEKYDKTRPPEMYVVLRIGVFVARPFEKLTFHQHTSWAYHPQAALHKGIMEVQKKWPALPGYRYTWHNIKVM